MNMNIENRLIISVTPDEAYRQILKNYNRIMP